MPIATAPARELTPHALTNRVEELRAYHALYSPLFQRREQRESAQQYLHGLLLELPRKSIEPMVLALEGAKAKAVRTRQLCISEGAWEDEPILHRHWQAVEHTLGEDDGGLTLDGSDFLKQGQESVGVKRQYWGEVGKRATCQAGVYVGYASRRGYTLLDRRLSLPHAWVQEGPTRSDAGDGGPPRASRSRPSRRGGGRGAKRCTGPAPGGRGGWSVTRLLGVIQACVMPSLG